MIKEIIEGKEELKAEEIYIVENTRRDFRESSSQQKQTNTKTTNSIAMKPPESRAKRNCTLNIKYIEPTLKELEDLEK